MWGETKRMLFNKNFLAAWLIACISIAIGQTYPSLKKALACGTFISILEGSLKSQAVSFAIPVAAVLPWSDSILQEYKSGFLKEILPRTTRRQYVEGKVFSIMMSGARNPNGAGLPIFSLTTVSPAATILFASSITGPLMS